MVEYSLSLKSLFFMMGEMARGYPRLSSLLLENNFCIPMNFL